MKPIKASTLPSTGKITYHDFQKKVCVYDFIGTLMSLQKLSALMSNQIHVRIDLEFQFASLQIKHHLLLPKDFIPFLAKQAILMCSESSNQFNDLDLTHLIQSYINLETDLHHIDPKLDDAWLWPLRATNHQWHYFRLPSSIIGRYLHLFSKVFERSPDLKVVIDKNLGIGFLDILKIGFCIVSVYTPRPDGFSTAFRMSSFTNKPSEEFKFLLTNDNLLKFLSIFSINQHNFKIENKKYEIKDNVLKMYEFNPLKRYPVIKTDSKNEIEKYIIPSLPDFTYACFEGVYYVLLDKLDNHYKDELFKALGKAFEEYIGELIKYYKVDILLKAILLPEQTYNKPEIKSADWLLISDDTIFQIECKKRKLDNFSKAGIDSEDSSGISTFLNSVANELDKFPRKEEHIKQNLLKNINYNNQKFINIIVYLDEMFAINKYARNEIKEKMQNHTDNFFILGCHDFESLCQYAHDNNINLKRALTAVVENDVESPLNIDYLDNIYEQFVDNLLKKKQ
jgi:hypothetical protein